MTERKKGRTEAVCLMLLAGLGLLMSKVVGCSVPAQAHDEAACLPCPPIPECPPEGYMLLALPEAPTEGQQTIEEALQAIEAAQEASKKGGPTP